MQRANGGDLLTHRGGERFGMCSTFKLPLAALILREADQGNFSLQDFVPYTRDDMLPHAPVTTEHLEDGGMTIEALAEAAQTTSDNPAANLLLRLIDGPQGFTHRLRTAGDTVTRLDRYELELNYVPKGEVRGHDDTLRDGRNGQQLCFWVDAFTSQSRAIAALDA